MTLIAPTHTRFDLVLITKAAQIAVKLILHTTFAFNAPLFLGFDVAAFVIVGFRRVVFAAECG